MSGCQSELVEDYIVDSSLAFRQAQCDNKVINVILDNLIKFCTQKKSSISERLLLLGGRPGSLRRSLY